ncbi:pheromone A receptor-domain-containing protein [Mycena vulgaris]|nr:pheromone A receptor-domain-containing protein [Mycena vulgaris]
MDGLRRYPQLTIVASASLPEPSPHILFVPSSFFKMPSALTAAPFIASALVLATFPHHWRVKNIATLSIIAWLSVYDLTYGVNAIIWEGNVELRALIWCDIATKVKIGADVGLPGCCLCMARQLNRIAYGLEMSPRGWSYRALDVFLCWGFPVLIMALHYIVQGHRADIVQDLGCTPAIYVSWPSIIILDLSAFIPAILALMYCGVALSKLYRRRVTFRLFRDKMQPETSLSPSRYIRLMIMTTFLGCWNAVLISISLSNEYTTGLQPWTDWVSVHANFSFVGQYSLSNFDSATNRCIYMLWWAVPLSSLAFFAFFGIGQEAMKDYRASADWFSRVVLKRPPQQPCRDDSDDGGAADSRGCGAKHSYILPSVRAFPPLTWEV